MDSKDFKRFDMTIKPQNVKWYLKPIITLLTRLGFKKHQTQVTYINTEDVKAPFILLCNHNAFQDFKVSTTVLGKNPYNYVVAIDGFLKREWLLRSVGCICKRKFTNDIILVRQIKRALQMKHSVVIYPEARYSLCGTTAVLPESLGKMCKLYNVPVLTLMCHGHHINSPFWDTSHERGVKPTEATYKLLFTPEDLKNMSVDEINKKIVEDFQYDDFKWQLERKIKVSDPNRAVGLHKVLYQCPHCKKEFMMSSFGSTLKCNSCLKEWEMNEYGQLIAKDGKTEFTHIPDWYEWERNNVRNEVINGTYSTGMLNVQVDSLPNTEFIDMGKGTLIHDIKGFTVKTTDKDGDIHEMKKDVKSMYSCHIEYQYLFKKGDCIDLNTLTDTWYIFPEGNNFAVTKIALATEELYFNELRKEGKEIKKGLA